MRASLVQENMKLTAGQDVILNTLRGKNKRAKRDTSGDDTTVKKRRANVSDGMEVIAQALRESESTRLEI